MLQTGIVDGAADGDSDSCIVSPPVWTALRVCLALGQLVSRRLAVAYITVSHRRVGGGEGEREYEEERSSFLMVL